MASRTRSKGPTVTSGGILCASADKVQWTCGPAGLSPMNYWKVMDDVTSSRPWPDHPMSVFTARCESYYTINGSTTRQDNSGLWYRFHDVRHYSLNSCQPGYILSPSYVPNFLDIYSRALANINPNIPFFDLPLFLFEMKDFPGMLKGLGDVLSNRAKPDAVPGGYLAYRFGWAPLFNDLSSLLNFARALEARKRMLRNLSKGSHKLRRTLRSGGGPLASYIHNDLLFNAIPYPVMRLNVDAREEFTEWYTCRLKSDFVIPPGSSLDFEALAAMLGGNHPAATLWNMMPWSWLVDYFWNVGEFIEGSGGVIPYTIHNLNLCSSRRAVTTVTPLNPYVDGLSGTIGKRSIEYFDRHVPAITTPILFPRLFLTGSMLGVLGALMTRGALRSL